MTDLKRLCDEIRELPDTDNVHCYDHEIRTDDLKALVSAYEAATEWIPCSERLPEVGTTYFARRHDGCIDVGTVSEGEYDSGYWQGLYVVWMPIPPYQHKSEGDRK